MATSPETIEVSSTRNEEDQSKREEEAVSSEVDLQNDQEPEKANANGSINKDTRGASASDDSDACSTDVNGSSLHSENDTTNGVEIEKNPAHDEDGNSEDSAEAGTSEQILGNEKVCTMDSGDDNSKLDAEGKDIYLETVESSLDNDEAGKGNATTEIETQNEDTSECGDESAALSEQAAETETETETQEELTQENEEVCGETSIPVSAQIAETEVRGEPTSETVDTNADAEEETNTGAELSIVSDAAQDYKATPTQVPIPPHKPSAMTENGNHTNNDSILAELQENLQHQMTVRAEVENKLRNQAAELDEYKKKVEEYSSMEDELEQLNANLIQVVAQKSQLEQEVGKLRDGREDLEQKEAVLSNRLNNAKKKEASKSNVAGRLEKENEELKHELDGTKGKLNTVTAQKEKLENSMEKLKKKCVERVKMAEAALIEERGLNEERKKKMKVFVESKAEELRSARSGNDELRAELKETSGALQSVRGKLEHMTRQFDHTSTKNRELTREMNRMKKNSEQLHQLGGNLELELQKSAQETEEHKNKRLTAKHELMTILRKLEAEQAVSGKLRDSVKFTFTPKAMSQQQLLTENLEDFESELLKLSRRLGKSLPPSSHDAFRDHGGENGSLDGTGDGSSEQTADNGKKKVNSRSEWDTTRLLSSLEEETQQVSKGIMAFSNAVERLRSLLDTSGEKTCANTLNEIFGALAAARADPHAFNGAAALPTSHTMSNDDEDGAFAGSPVKRRSAERYGLVGQDNS